MKRPIMSILAIMIVLGFFSVMAVLLYAMFAKIEIGGPLKDILFVMLGALGSMTTQIISYYFGSSQGSHAKDFLLAQKEPVPPQ